MAEKRRHGSPPLRTERQVSAGGVAFRRRDGLTEVAIVKVGPRGRWQLPKGLVDGAETPERAALREVREEAGIETRMIEPLETIEYWYVASRGAERVRYHKRVHFFLVRYRRGDVRDHDHEVEEARWVPIDEAETKLAFENERRVMALARAAIERAAKPAAGEAEGDS